MKLLCNAVHTEKYVTDKGRAYLTFVDLDQGGQFRISVDGDVDLKPGEMVKLDLMIKAGSSPKIGMFLQHVGGNIIRSNGKGVE